MGAFLVLGGLELGEAGLFFWCDEEKGESEGDGGRKWFRLYIHGYMIGFGVRIEWFDFFSLLIFELNEEVD